MRSRRIDGLTPSISITSSIIQVESGGFWKEIEPGTDDSDDSVPTILLTEFFRC